MKLYRYGYKKYKWGLTSKLTGGIGGMKTFLSMLFKVGRGQKIRLSSEYDQFKLNDRHRDNPPT